jgi:hypothetical protein
MPANPLKSLYEMRRAERALEVRDEFRLGIGS